MERRKLIKQSLIAAAGIGVAATLTHCKKNKNNNSVETAAVHSKKKIKWSMVTSWPKNSPGLGTGANFLADTITKMSNGELSVKVFGGGELIPPFEVFDAVSKGTAQMAHSAAFYWKAKAEATQFFAAVPFGLTADEMSGWINYGGGQAIWDELYAGFNLKPFAAGNTGVQLGGWFNKEINSIQDYQGLKMRIPGLGGDVLKRLGGTPVTLPGGEIFQALQTGVIDATEWSGPYSDLSFGFYKAAKYYYWPGWHEPGTVVECFVNKKDYDALPAHLKNIVKNASEAAYTHMLSEFTARNALALEELTNQHAVTLKRFPDPVLKAAGKIAVDVVAEVGNKPENQKVYQSFDHFRKRAIFWNKIGESGFSHARRMVFPS